MIISITSEVFAFQGVFTLDRIIIVLPFQHELTLFATFSFNHSIDVDASCYFPSPKFSAVASVQRRKVGQMDPNSSRSLLVQSAR